MIPVINNKCGSQAITKLPVKQRRAAHPFVCVSLRSSPSGGSLSCPLNNDGLRIPSVTPPPQRLLNFSRDNGRFQPRLALETFTTFNGLATTPHENISSQYSMQGLSREMLLQFSKTALERLRCNRPSRSLTTGSFEANFFIYRPGVFFNYRLFGETSAINASQGYM